MQCDVSNDQQVQDTLRDIRSRCGTIAGIIHSAGVVRDGMMRTGSVLNGCEEVWMALCFFLPLLLADGFEPINQHSIDIARR